MNIIETLEAEHAAKLPGAKMPDFQPGDTVVVNVKVTEGDRTRVQAYEGVCIARSGSGLNESFTVRKISYGEGVERVFPVYSPMIDSVKVVRRGKVRRAKLYYLRDRRGKSARIAERTEANRTRGRQAAKTAGGRDEAHSLAERRERPWPDAVVAQKAPYSRRCRSGQDLLLVRLRQVRQPAVLRRLAQGRRHGAESVHRREDRDRLALRLQAVEERALLRRLA